MGGDVPENPVLPDAFPGGFAIMDRVAGTGMEEAVIASRRPGGNVAPLDQERPQSPHRAVALRAGAGDAPADDDDVKFIVFHGLGSGNAASACRNAGIIHTNI